MMYHLIVFMNILTQKKINLLVKRHELRPIGIFFEEKLETPKVDEPIHHEEPKVTHIEEPKVEVIIETPKVEVPVHHEHHEPKVEVVIETPKVEVHVHDHDHTHDHHDHEDDHHDLEHHEDDEVPQIPEESRQLVMESIHASFDDIENIDIKSDSDLANFIIQLVNRHYEPFFENYLNTLNTSTFHAAGKQGWDVPEDSPQRKFAREPINQLKNQESIRLYKLDFTNQVAEIISKKVAIKVSGVSRQIVRRAIRKHIRLMLTDFLYPSI